MRRGPEGWFALAAALALITVSLGLLCASRPASAQEGSAGFSRAGQWIIDDRGRVVIFHGFNIPQKSAPFYPDWLTEQDAKFLASEGFNAARIALIWAAAEPQPGVYDDAYIRKVMGVNALLAKHGIHTLLDMHQDNWNIDDRIDGAPAWATFGPDGSYGQHHFQAFWDNRPARDGVGIQTHFIRLWAHVARIVDASTYRGNIIGFDPLNEPYPGIKTGCPAFLSACPAFESGELADFYRQVIAAIRATGDEHVIWPEGGPTGRIPAALPKFDDPEMGYNFHYYCAAVIPAGNEHRLLTPGEEAGCRRDERQGLAAYLHHADSFGLPAFLSEFGCSDDPEDQSRMVDAADRAWVSWTQWQYRTQGPAGDVCPGILLDSSQPGSLANAKLSKLAALAVPYPQAIAGTPESYEFDRTTRTMRLTYSTKFAPGNRRAAGLQTEIFVPEVQYPHGYTVQVEGARVVSRPNASRLALVSAHSASRVTVVIRIEDGHGGS